VDDLHQPEANLIAEGLCECPAEQFAPGRCKEGVVGGPNPEVSAVLVQFEHKIIERGNKCLQASFAFSQSVGNPVGFAVVAHCVLQN